MILEVQPFAELRGHNYFEEALVACSLPCVQNRSDIQVCSGGIKPCSGRITSLRSAVARNVASMCLPLALVFVLCIGHTDGHPLAIESRGARLPTRVRVRLRLLVRRAAFCHLCESEN